MDEIAKNLTPGTYLTKGGWTAHVWERGKNAVGEECFLGTEEGIGLGSWDEAGKSLSGDERSNLVMLSMDPTPESQAAWKRYSDALEDPELEVHLDEVSITDHGLEPGFTVRRRRGGLPPPLDKLTAKHGEME